MVIDSFSGNGIRMQSGSTGNVIEGDFIGTNPTGTSGLGNQENGVYVLGDGNTIGGTTPSARNLISGNGDISQNFNGIRLEFADNNVVQGNIIGLDRSGLNAIPNNGNGISDISGAFNTFGGNTPGAGNLISGNLLNGIVVQDVANATVGTGTHTLIAGNRIGTDVTGMIDRGNGYAGVLLVSVTDVVIGGTTSSASNLISGNDTQGVWITFHANNNVVEGNWIGVDATGAAALANATGVEISDSSADNSIGGSTAAERQHY